ncbi:KH domain protein [Methanocaldococcus infernus ME]|uniref:KH domain protein n=1 Tax=Methanocaldococcus infernus (strain DSM 11812 / JCM 15783 / ME) TaxID=573063 RepID=D5VS35_METIM|nr:KH domain-containing protein [Methanocaldococcus infernus]ADG13388.1 KH domain protein [Methanocaldococcus infernus ME]
MVFNRVGEATNVEIIKVPKDRIGVLIGKGGEVKKRIEDELKVKIKIDADGTVTIYSKNNEDPLALWKAKDIVKAIARGFNPEIALRLLSDDYVLEIINIEDYAKSENSLRRLKGRVIGKEGKSRRYIEELTGASVSVYGKTVSIVGEADQVQIAKEAVEMLLRGASHSRTYKFLERERQKLKEANFKLWKKKSEVDELYEKLYKGEEE